MVLIPKARIRPRPQFEPHLKQSETLMNGGSSIIHLVFALSAHAQAHCLLILLLSNELPAHAIRRVINVSQVGFAHLLQVVIEKEEGALSQLSGRQDEIEVFYSGILLRSVFQKIIQINLSLRKSIHLNFQIFETRSVC